MMRLKSKLLSLNADKTTKAKIFSPANTEELRIPFRVDKTAKVVGRLAQISPPKGSDFDDDGQLITGVLVQNDFKLSLMAPEDLREYAGLTTTTITCKQHLTLSAAGLDLIKWALEGTFGAIEEIGPNVKSKVNGHANGSGNDGTPVKDAIHDEQMSHAYLVMGCVIVQYQRGGQVTVEWEGNVMNDGVADAVMAILFSVESSPAAVKRELSSLLTQSTSAHIDLESSRIHGNGHNHTMTNPHADISSEERFSRLCMFLEAQFGEAIVPIVKPKLKDTSVKSPSAMEVDGIKAEPYDNERGHLEEIEAAELERLHNIGIPVPGLVITVDKHIARVWLETLEVECSNGVLRDRVKAVVERAVETVAPLWTLSKR